MELEPKELRRLDSETNNSSVRQRDFKIPRKLSPAQKFEIEVGNLSSVWPFAS